jgi:hypothetical protein
MHALHWARRTSLALAIIAMGLLLASRPLTTTLT